MFCVPRALRFDLTTVEKFERIEHRGGLFSLGFSLKPTERVLGSLPGVFARD
jgi:hypothetical protein